MEAFQVPFKLILVVSKTFCWANFLIIA